MDDLYFHARKLKDGIEITGTPSCSFGHKLSLSKRDKHQGIFGEWLWDGDRLTVRNDRYGFFPIYYFEQKGEICISTSIARLIKEGAATDLNEPSLAVFLRLGFFIGEDTPFRAIRALPPDALIEWQDGKLQISGQLHISKPQHLKRKEIIDSYISLFRIAIRRRVPMHENFALPLSGGQDSRHILLELCESDYRPKLCVTACYYPPIADREVEAASLLTKALRIEHLIIQQNNSRLEAEQRKNIKTNLCALEHSWFIAVADFLNSKVRTVYDGIGGDVLSAGLFLNARRLALYDSANFIGLAEHLLDEYKQEPALKSILPKKQYRRFCRDLALDHLKSEIERHSNAPNPVGSLFFWNRTRRTIAVSPYCLLDSVPQVHSPYLDHDLYDFLSSLPATVFLDYQLHIETIASAYPRYSEIPYSEKKRFKQNHSYFRQFAWELLSCHLNMQSIELIRKSFLLPRLLRCLIDNSYSESVNWLGPLSLYLLQLEMLAKGYSGIMGTNRHFALL